MSKTSKKTSKKTSTKSKGKSSSKSKSKGSSKSKSKAQNKSKAKSKSKSKGKSKSKSKSMGKSKAQNKGKSMGKSSKETAALPTSSDPESASDDAVDSTDDNTDDSTEIGSYSASWNASLDTQSPPPPPPKSKRKSKGKRKSTIKSKSKGKRKMSLKSKSSSDSVVVAMRKDIERYRQLDFSQRKRFAAYYRPVRVPNWPTCCPFLSHNINEDVSSDARFTVRFAYTTWYVVSLAYLANVAGVSWAAIRSEDSATAAALSATYFVVGSTLSFFLWYRPLYTATRSSTPGQLTLFVFTSILQLAVLAFFAIGVPGSGTAGYWLATNLYEVSEPGGILCYCIGGLFTVLAVAHVPIILSTYRTHAALTRTNFAAETRRANRHIISSKRRSSRPASSSADTLPPSRPSDDDTSYPSGSDASV